MSDVIRTSRDGAVATVTIDRPADGNVLTTDMLRALRIRAMVSEALPAANGTTIVTGRVGQSCAAAPCGPSITVVIFV